MLNEDEQRMISTLMAKLGKAKLYHNGTTLRRCDNMDFADCLHLKLNVDIAPISRLTAS